MSMMKIVERLPFCSLKKIKAMSTAAGRATEAAKAEPPETLDNRVNPNTGPSLWFGG